MKVHHDQIKDQKAVMGSFFVEFDSEGNGIVEDEEYAEQLLESELGFSKVEEKKLEKEAEKEKEPEKPKEPERKPSKILPRRAAKADK